MTRDEIKDFVDVSSKKDIEEYINELETELYRVQRGLETAQALIRDSISIERYNEILTKYKELLKNKK